MVNETFPRRSQLHISNSILQVVAIEGSKGTLSIDFNPTLYRTMKDFLNEATATLPTLTRQRCQDHEQTSQSLLADLSDDSSCFI
jgi:hypothetical protein